jgi:RHS repeat-associated protein
MMMPGRKFTAQNGYRYGFNGQEKSDEIGNSNSYTAEFWEYDARIGRRWNTDPITKAYESPYAALGNNPIWNIDPNGADTAKYLSNSQLVDAIKIANNEIKSVVKDKRDYRSNQVEENLGKAVTDYISKNELTFGAAAEFQKAVTDYYHGLEAVATYSKTEFERMDRLIINNKQVNNYWTVRLTVQGITEMHAKLWRILGASVDAAVFVSTLGVGTRTGPPPRVPLTKSDELQKLFDAGYKQSFINDYFLLSKTINNNGVYRTNIWALAYTGSNKTGNLLSVLNSIETQARSAGARTLIIRGEQIVNTSILNVSKEAAQKYGYQLEKIGEDQITLTKSLK